MLLPTVTAAQLSLGVVTTLVGQTTLTRRTPPTPHPLRFKDALFAHDRIATAARALVRVPLGFKALVTVRELSAFTITKGAREQAVRLAQGKLAASILHSRMRPGEVIEIRTPNAVAAVRGTVVIVEVLAPSMPGATPNTRITVTRGIVGVTRTGKPGRVEVSVPAGQVYDVATNRLRPLTAAEAVSIWADLTSDPQFPSLPDDFSRSLGRTEVERTSTDSPWGTGLDQVFRVFPLSLLTGVVASGVSGGGRVGRGCGAGVGGGAGVGCAGKGQGAARGKGLQP